MSRRHKSESPVGTGLIAEGSIENGLIVGTADDERKRFTTLCARAAIAGHEVRREPIDGGGWYYVIRRWGLRRELASLDDVCAWLDRVTGIAA
jgi:hypothetical protein